jgi:hypothetical protein
LRIKKILKKELAKKMSKAKKTVNKTKLAKNLGIGRSSLDTPPFL